MGNVVYMIDIGLLILIVICAFSAYRAGFFSAIANLLGSVCAFIGANIISGKLSEIIFNNFLKTGLTQKTFEYFTTTAENINVESAVKGLLGFLPQEVIYKFTSMVETNIQPTYEYAQTFTDMVLKPIITGILAIILFIVIYFLLKIVVNIIVKALKFVNVIPLIGFVNRVLGFGVGAVTGGLYIVVISFILTTIIIFTNNSLSFLNYSIISQSKILALTSAINPFIL